MATKQDTQGNAERVVTTGNAARRRRTAGPSRLGAPDGAPQNEVSVVGDRSADAQAWLSSLRPSQVTESEWSSVKDSVLEWGRLLVVEHGYGKQGLQRPVRALIKLAVHLHGTQRLTLTTVLDPYTINQYAAALKKADPSVGTYQSLLRHVGRLLNPAAPWEVREPVNTRDVAAPYSEEELRLLERDIPRNEPVRARAGEGLLVLGLGAGLDGRWVAKARKEDVLDLDPRDPLLGRGILVSGRLVPVLAKYEARLDALMTATPAGGLLVGGIAQNKNASSDICDRLQLAPGTPRVNCGRLRSTWLVTHLTLGSRTPELAEAAGVVGLTTFSDLLEFVPPPSKDIRSAQLAARQMLRGPK